MELETRHRVYDFLEFEHWFEVGLQILLASGWRPDCVWTEEYSVLRTGPLALNAPRPLAFGSPQAVTW